MADPTDPRPGFMGARAIAAATGERVSAVLNMLRRPSLGDDQPDQKREPVIHTRVTGRKWVDMPGGGRAYAAVSEEYEAFPGLEWPYKFKDAWEEIPMEIGLDIIRRIRTYREAINLRVPSLPDNFFDPLDEAAEGNRDPQGPDGDTSRQVVALPAEPPPTRHDMIVAAVRAFPLGGRWTRRNGPYVRDLRADSGMKNITTSERNAAWKTIKSER